MTCIVSQLRQALIPAMLLVIGSSAAFADLSPTFERKEDSLVIRAGGPALRVSLRSPVFSVDEETIADAAPQGTTGSVTGGQTLTVSYAPVRLRGSAALEVKVFLRWSPGESVLRKWATVRLVGPHEPRVLKEVVLEQVQPRGQKVWTHGGRSPGTQGRILLDDLQSHPVFMPGLFLGVEYPVASTRYKEAKIVVAHRPGRRMQPGVWYDTRAAVYGFTPIGEEVRSFQRYIAAHRPKPGGFHVNYNSWWTSPVPYTEKDIVGLMNVFEERLYKAHGVSFDTFCIDMGWSDAKSIWQIDPKHFPAEFAPLRDAARKMQSNLGLWISPSGCYPSAMDDGWAKAQGFETCAQGPTGPRLLCLGGKRYAQRLKARLADMVGRYGIGHLKFDGYHTECGEVDHGHEPGACSAEAIAEGLIGAAEGARAANPHVWIETTCMGYNPSPWWLFYANSVIGTFGDDAPLGRVPSPVYRESATTARDFFNLQGAELLPVPVCAQEVLGIIHQTPDAFLNDAVTVVMRGHMFLPLYVNPKFMDDSRWSALAELLRWARKNAEALGETVPLLPASWRKGSMPCFSDQGTMPREPYGYAHVAGRCGLVALRNPWIAPQTYSLKLDAGLGFSPAAADLTAVSLYPEPRLYGEKLKFGDTLVVPLAPYETVVLSLGRLNGSKDLGAAGKLPRVSPAQSALEVLACRPTVQRVTFQGSQAPLGPNWTCRLGDVRSAVRFALDAKVRLAAPQAELLVLCEGAKPPAAPVGRLSIDHRDVEFQTTSSASGWSATGLPAHEHWTFLQAPLVAGEHEISLDQFAGGDCTKISAWVWATKRGGGAGAWPNSLPQPEVLSLGGAALLAPTQCASLPQKAVVMQPPVDRIDGVFLDALAPVSVKQGWGMLQKNRSVWEKPMVINGRQFLRGLGTHAPSRIVFALEGKYRRFQTWAGADGNTYPTVTFEVWVDGVKRWHSGLMTRDTAAAWIDLDVSVAKRLELIVGDAGDFMGDHADWAEARLLR
jgi:hypothetical protein